MKGQRRFSKKLPIIEVLWSDSLLFMGGWEPHDVVMRTSRRILQRSVGYVLKDDKTGVVLTESLGQVGDVYGTVAIPASQIVKRRKLR